MPAVTNVSAPPVVIVQIPVVTAVNVGVRPEEAVAVRVGVLPKVWAPGLLNVIVCIALGVTAAEATDAVLVPTAFVAVTVKV